MAGYEALVPQNPVELAVPYAEQLRTSQGFHDFSRSDAEYASLGQLNEQAQVLDMLGSSYFVQSSLAYVIPDNFMDPHDVDAEESYFVFEGGLTFEGNFATYAIMKVGQIEGAPGSTRAVCMASDSALMLPFFERIEEGHMLYVPLVAVDDIKLAA